MTFATRAFRLAPIAAKQPTLAITWAASAATTAG